MIEIQPHKQAESDALFVTQQEDAPFAIEMVTLSRQKLIELTASKNRYISLHKRVLEKNKALEEQLKLEQAKVLDLTHRLYGKKTEKSTTTAEILPSTNDFVGPPLPPAKRGAKPSRENRPRRKHPNLPVKEEIIPIPEEQSCCAECGKAYLSFPKTEDSEIIEISCGGSCA